MLVHKPISAKIIVGSCGLGTPDMDLVEKRAREVAKIQAHPSPTPADWAEARRELHGLGVGQEAGSAGAEAQLGGEIGFEGDVPNSLANLLPDSKATRSLNEDDPTLGEELVREGMEEAEHERMLLARRNDQR